MISPDHPTFLRTKVHTHGNVPVAMAGTGRATTFVTGFDGFLARELIKLLVSRGHGVLALARSAAHHRNL